MERRGEKKKKCRRETEGSKQRKYGKGKRGTRKAAWPLSLSLPLSSSKAREGISSNVYRYTAWMALLSSPPNGQTHTPHTVVCTLRFFHPDSRSIRRHATHRFRSIASPAFLHLLSTFALSYSSPELFPVSIQCSSPLR